jgi:HEAT repeat protein
VAHSVAISFGFILSGLALRIIQVQGLGLEWAFALLVAAGAVALLAARGADAGYLEALVEATQGGHREDRMAALTVAIAYSGGSAEAPVLLATRNPALEKAMVEAVGRSGGEEFTRHLAEAIEEAGPEVAHSAVEALARSHLPGELSTRLLTGLLSREDRKDRLAALRLAASLEDSSLVPALRGLLEDPGTLEPPDLPRVAEALLRTAGDPEDLRIGVKVLRRAGTSSEFPERAATARTLGRLGMPAFVEHLGKALLDPSDEVGEAAARALERTGTPDAAEALEAARDDARAASRRAAIEEALVRLRDPHRHQVARRLASFRDRERKRLARAMQLDGAGKTLPLVAKALEIEWAPARAAVVRTLQEVEEEDFHAAVDEALGEGAEAREADPVPLLAFCARRHPGPGHPARDLLQRIYQADHRASVVAFCAAELGGTDFRRDDREELRARLELISAMVGIMVGDSEGFRDAFDAALGSDPRKASAAIELIETGAQAPILKRRLAKGLEILRERVA